MVVAQPLASFDQLIDTLWLERRILEHLLFKLVLANLLLGADDRRFIPKALAEVEHGVEGVRRIDAERNRVVHAAAVEWHVSAHNLTLGYLATDGPEALRESFEGHRAAFLELVSEIGAVTQENRRLAMVSLDGIGSTLGLAEPLTPDAAERRGRPDGNGEPDRAGALMSDSVALYTAFSGLRAAQAAMDTASHSVANAGTDGYTRQGVELATRQPSYRRSGYIGTGVDVIDITRASNAFLDDRFRASARTQGRLATLGDMLDGIESAMGEPDHGITAGLGGLWASFEDLALDPTDTAARLGVITNLDNVADRIRTTAQEWNASGATAATDITSRVTETNRLLEQVARLNGEIVAATAAGGSPNDLFDARDIALDRLATLAGTTATITESGTARVTLNGLALVHDLQVSRLSYDAGSNRILHASGTTVRPGGEIAGLHGFLATELPQMRTSLDDLAAALADALNSRHAAGYTPAGAAGGPLFSYVAGDAALRLAVAVSNPAGLAAAGSSPVARFDGVNAEALAALRLDLAAAGTQTLDEAVRSIVTSVAQSLASARSSMASQTALMQAAQAARTQAHGVSIDEEMVDLVTYQRAYEAAARVMTTVDEALDVLISRTGIVGR